MNNIYRAESRICHHLTTFSIDKLQSDDYNVHVERMFYLVNSIRPAHRIIDHNEDLQGNILLRSGQIALGHI